MKNDDSLPQKNVPHHDDRFIHRCQVRLCEDNQLYMLPSIYLINIRRFYIFLTHSLMLDSREKERKRRIVLLRFGFIGEERKKNVFCIILSKRWRNLISWRQDHSLEHPVLKTSWLASKVRSSARRRRWERKQREEQYRTFLTSLRYQDLPSCSCDSRSIQHSLKHRQEKKLDLENQTWRISSVSFFSSIVRIFSFSKKPNSSEKINARKNILDIAW